MLQPVQHIVQIYNVLAAHSYDICLKSDSAMHSVYDGRGMMALQCRL